MAALNRSQIRRRPAENNLTGEEWQVTLGWLLMRSGERCEMCGESLAGVPREQVDARTAAGGRFVPPEVIEKMHARIVSTIGDGPVPGFRVTRRIGPGIDRVFWGPTAIEPERLTMYRDAPWLR